MRSLLEKLLACTDLTRDEARRMMSRIIEGALPPATVSAFLVALRMKGESPVEVAGCAEAMLASAVRVDTPDDPLVDTCGTGGDGAHTINISTISAFVVAGAGVKVAKHGNRSVTSKCGSADLLDALGVKMVECPVEAARCLEEVGLTFLFAPFFHPAMKNVAPIRRELGVRTVFNILGPLTNPAGVRRHLIGVYAPHLCELLAQVLRVLGAEEALIVHGGGLDEISPCGETLVAHLKGAEITSSTLTPEALGFTRHPIAALAGGEPGENAAKARTVLAGEAGPMTDAVVMNAAAALAVSGAAGDLREGVAMARESLASGSAYAVLGKLAAFNGGA